MTVIRVIKSVNIKPYLWTTLRNSIVVLFYSGVDKSV